MSDRITFYNITATHSKNCKNPWKQNNLRINSEYYQTYITIKSKYNYIIVNVESSNNFSNYQVKYKIKEN